MKSSLAKCLGVVAFALLLSASVSQQMAQAQIAAADGIAPTTLIIGETESNVALSDQFELQTTLQNYIDPDATGAGTQCPELGGPPTVGREIAKIRKCNVTPGVGNRRIPGLRGLGGALGLMFLDRASNAVGGATPGKFNPGSRVLVSMHGQINDFTFTEDAVDPMIGNGTLDVTTYITWKVVSSGSGNPAPKTESYRWVIDVANDGFQIEPNSTDPLDPFPVSGMTFDQDMLKRIESLDFKFKLWARGLDIEVKQLWYKAWNKAVEVQIAGTQKPDGSPFSTSTKYDRLDDPDDEACIDIFFAVPTSGDVPADMPGLKALGGPPFYCLGRCANPKIINTGV